MVPRSMCDFGEAERSKVRVCASRRREHELPPARPCVAVVALVPNPQELHGKQPVRSSVDLPRIEGQTDE